MFEIPAGLTIANFVVNSLGWYLTLRNFTQTLYLDIKTTSNAGRDKVSLTQRLEEQRNRFMQFQKDWLILDRQLPDDLYREIVWDHKAYEDITRMFENIRSRIEEIAKKVGKWKESDENRSDENNRDKQKKGPLYRVKAVVVNFGFATLDKPYITQRLQELDGDIDRVERSAKAGYRRRYMRRGKRGDVDLDELRSKIIGYLLIRLAIKWARDITSFRESLSQLGNDFFVELDLSTLSGIAPTEPRRVDDPESAHAEAMLKIAASGELNLTVLTGRKERQNLNPLRITVRISSKPAVECLLSSYEAFSQMVDPRGNRTSCDYRATHNTNIGIARAEEQISNQASRIILRDMLFPRNPTVLFFRSMQQEHELSKYRAVFELSQVYLIFLRTTWLDSLCSCHMRCRKTMNAPKYEFSLSMNDNQHQSRRFAGNPENDLWCNRTNVPSDLDAPIHLLGILFLEITFGAHVLLDNNPFRERSIWLVEEDQEGRTRKELYNLQRLQKLQKRLEELSQQERNRNAIPRTANYASAVIYCFKKPAKARNSDEVKQELDNFYKHVVVQLREYYFTIEEQVFRQRSELQSLPNPEHGLSLSTSH